MPTVRYTTVEGEVLAEKRGGVRHQYVPDPLGSTVALLDNTQAQTDTFAYWPYGEVATRTGTTATPLQFVGTLGYYKDSATRTYVRARTLDTGKGRWLTQDPIGLAGGGNLYSYAASNPVNYIDTSGNGPISHKLIGGRAWDILAECGVEKGPPFDLNVLATVFRCIAKAESDYDPHAKGKGTISQARGLYQLGQDQYDDCISGSKCTGGIYDPICNLRAAVNLFISMCNDRKFDQIRKPPHFVETPRDPLSALRGNWGCVRGEGPVFQQCLKDNGITQQRIKDIPCPPKSKKCPGCKKYHPVKYRGGILPW